MASADLTLSNVLIRGKDHEDSPGELLVCHNLVLSAGPFTTGIFSELFKHSPIELSNFHQGSD